MWSTVKISAFLFYPVAKLVVSAELTGGTTERLMRHQRGQQEDPREEWPRTGYVHRPCFFFTGTQYQADQRNQWGRSQSGSCLLAAFFFLFFFCVWIMDSVERKRLKPKRKVIPGGSLGGQLGRVPLFCCFVLCSSAGKADRGFCTRTWHVASLECWRASSPTGTGSVGWFTARWLLFPLYSLHPSYCYYCY